MSARREVTVVHDSARERARIRRIIRAVRNLYLTEKPRGATFAAECARAVYVCDTLLGAIKSKRRAGR